MKYLKDFLGEKVWYLAGGSHPVKILDPDRVKVLISSSTESALPKGSPILVRFTHGKGTVYHMISHFNLQTGSGKGAGFSPEQLASPFQSSLASPYPSSSSPMQDRKSNGSSKPGALPPMAAPAMQPLSFGGGGGVAAGGGGAAGDMRAASEYASNRGASDYTVGMMQQVQQQQQQVSGSSAISYQNIQSAANSSEFFMRSVLQHKRKK